MTIVDKETFSNLVKDPARLKADAIPMLKATIKAFPYCQIPYSLLAKASSLSGNEELDKSKPLAAAYALSRIALQTLVETSTESPDLGIEAPIEGSGEKPAPQDGEDILIGLVTQESSAALQLQKSEEQKRQQQIIQGFMKKNPRIIRQESNLEPVNIDVSNRVAQSGSGSIETEAFAKILIRQGKTDKAIDVYQKLLLKNPEKRDYFAKKLSELYQSGQ